MVAQQMIDHFSLDLSLPSLTNSQTTFDFHDRDPETVTLDKVLATIHPIMRYHRRLSELVGEPMPVKARQFNRLRTSMPFRSEYAFLELPELLLERFPVLSTLGITSSS